LSFSITTIVGESSQKLNKIGKTFSSRCGVYLAIPREDKSNKQKRQKPEKVRKTTKLFPLRGKRQKYLAKVPPF
jgi:hypothetical protein